MKTHRNTLYVTTQGTYLCVERENLVARANRETIGRFPLHMLEGIVCLGNITVSPFLLGRASERGIGISFLTERGRFLARVVGGASGNVLLRREQFRRAEDEVAAAELARAFVGGKVANARSLLLRSLRDHPDAEGRDALRGAAEALATSLRNLQKNPDLSCIRGIEGNAARAYFQAFGCLIVTQRSGFPFTGRTRRPPLDRVNALLSFLYSLLTHDAASALQAAGLDPQVGFLHRFRPGRPGLALDLVEELRPLLGDRLAIALINRRQVREDGFEVRETGGVSMDEGTRKTVLKAYQERKKEEITHPFLNEKTTVGMVAHLQALLLARHLRGDLDAYPPFIPR
jgi:CRISP-associated protein Cas1